MTTLRLEREPGDIGRFRTKYEGTNTFFGRRQVHIRGRAKRDSVHELRGLDAG